MAETVVPDGGWGWMVVLGSFLMHVLLGGLSRSYGLIYIQLRQMFNSTAAITAWVGGMFVAFRMGGSKLIIDHEAGEIICLVASICLFVCALLLEPFDL